MCLTDPLLPRHIGRSKDRSTLDEIKEFNSRVSPWMPDRRPAWPTSRTLWYSMYDLDARTMKVKFYHGETKDPSDETTVVTRYSEFLEFRLAE